MQYIREKFYHCSMKELNINLTFYNTMKGLIQFRKYYCESLYTKENQS
jgi:hypothetical protein